MTFKTIHIYSTARAHFSTVLFQAKCSKQHEA